MMLTRNRFTPLAALALLCVPLLTACEPDGPGGLAEDICGPCGSIETGQLSISGNAQLDGFFSAVYTVDQATARIRGDFEGNIVALAEVYGVAGVEAGYSAQLLADLKTAISADITASVDANAGISVRYKGPECKASIDVAVEAQASCEVQAECDVQVDPGQVSVACEGTCSGGCSGSCSGELSCAVTTPTVNCEGTCEGSCELMAATTCEGTCRGQCSGTCSATDANGDCAGTCSGGDCTGTCELSAAATCMGTCHGTCKVEQGSAQCTADAQCSGSCDAECSGSCAGEFEPPSASADCDASADCKAQASAQANASVECTPPSLELDFAFANGVNAAAQAAFIGRIGELKTRGVAILQGAANLEVLLTGKVNGEVVFEVSPVDQLKGSIQGLIDAGFSGDLNIPTGRLPCVLPAFQDSLTALVDVGTGFTGTISAQADFASFITTGL
jgi:modification target Cys-rich repeat protein